MCDFSGARRSFFLNDPATAEIYTLSLHDALPISVPTVLFVDGYGCVGRSQPEPPDRKSTRLNSSHSQISYAVFCLKKKKKKQERGQYEMKPKANATRYCISVI